MNENPYDILGIPRTASMDEVKKAYRKKARENHPDLNPDDPQAEERMNKVNEAYDRIMNPEKYEASDARRRYSSAAQNAAAGAGAHGGPSGGTSGPQGTGGNPYGNPYGGQYGNPYGQGYGQWTRNGNEWKWEPGGNGQNTYGWTTINFDEFFNTVGSSQASRASIHPEAAAGDSDEVRQAINCINSESWKDAIDILQRIPSTGRNARWHYLFAIANNGAGNVVAANDNIRKARRLDPNNPTYVQAETQFVQGARHYENAAQSRGFTSFGIDPSLLCCLVCMAPTCISYFSRFCFMGYR